VERDRFAPSDLARSATSPVQRAEGGTREGSEFSPRPSLGRSRGPRQIGKPSRTTHLEPQIVDVFGDTSIVVEVLSRWRYDCRMDSSMTLESMGLEQRAEVLKAIADSSRLEILEILSPEIRCNCHLQEVLDLAPNLLSYHLKVLREAGLIEGTRRGRWVDYALTSDAHARIAMALPRDLAP
jgi:ArsR family transcriptional regulator